MTRSENSKKYNYTKPRPFIKWVGGKTQLLPELIGRLPEEYGAYHEPFIGGGALYFAQAHNKAIISDINEELINVYNTIKERPEELIRALKKHRYEEEYYYKIRNVDRSTLYRGWSDTRKAARFIFLNKTCFNGLYRVNAKGQFNAPFGSYKDPKICDAENIRACSEHLNQNTTILLSTFSDVVKRAKKYDLVYFDPPYAPLSATSNFTGYSKQGFDVEMQVKLRDCMDKLTDKGVYVMLSNSSAPLIYDLYEEYYIDEVMASRAVNSKATKRGKVKEVVVRNFQTNNSVND